MYHHFINGKWNSEGAIGEVLNPATEKMTTQFVVGGKAQMELAVEAARRAHKLGIWRKMGLQERSSILRAVATNIRARAEEFARIETTEQGRPLMQSLGMMVPLAANAFDFFAGIMLAHGGRSGHPSPAALAFTLKHPVGLVGCITPANVPLVLASEKLAPALAAGNCVILKPPLECPGSSVLLMECVQAAGIPAGVCNLVLGGTEAAEHLVGHPEVGMIAFTGSTATGKQIMRQSAGRLKRLLLELGGKAPQIVFEDADLPGAIEGALWGAFLNGGQICMASTRILVQRSRFQEFAERFVQRIRQIRVGPGLDPVSQMGPMLSSRVRDRVQACIRSGLSEGASMLCGGPEPPEATGYWVIPTVFADVKPEMNIYKEEVFGPVPLLIPFEDLDEAVAISHQTEYGLTGSVWTKDLDRALRVAEELEVGTVWINEHLIRAPGFPFGGWKQSGFGREACPETLDEYSQVKTVYLDRSPGGHKPRYQMFRGGA
jgi:phenylacetaldehyde dehydrogenase